MAKILVVDDDLDVAEVMTLIVAGEGHETRIARNGVEGLERVVQARPDLVLLDVEMPLLDGPGMAYEMFLRNLGSERIPVILISAIANLKEVAHRVGTPYWLSKPFRVDHALQLIDRALNERVFPVPLRRQSTE